MLQKKLQTIIKGGDYLLPVKICTFENRGVFIVLTMQKLSNICNSFLLNPILETEEE